jgi:hypothetical protein
MRLKKRTLRFVNDKAKDSTESLGHKKSVPVIRRRASEVMNYRLTKKFILVCIAIGAVVLLVSYALVLIYNRTGRFSVAVENTDAHYALTLSEDPDFKIRTSLLTNKQEVAITNICGNSIPQNVDRENGEHNGENYLAYTFYCKNVGDVKTSMSYEITFNNVTNHIDEAIRLRLYVDGEFTDYAKTRSDGNGDETHYSDKPFAGKYLVCKDITEGIDPNGYVRFTVVIWLEGDDQDCNDSIRFGQIKFDMNIEAKPAG